jgi:hypothetical protein
LGRRYCNVVTGAILTQPTVPVVLPSVSRRSLGRARSSTSRDRRATLPVGVRFAAPRSPSPTYLSFCRASAEDRWGGPVHRQAGIGEQRRTKQNARHVVGPIVPLIEEARHLDAKLLPFAEFTSVVLLPELIGGGFFHPVTSAESFDGLHASNDVHPLGDVLWRKD